VFAHLSAQYESFMAKVREGEAEQAQQPSPAPATLAGPAQSTNYEEPEELDEFIPPSVLQQPSPQLNKLKGSSPYNDRFPKDAFRKSAVSAPALVEEDSYISPKRCVAVWKGKCPGKPVMKVILIISLTTLTKATFSSRFGISRIMNGGRKK
jgi:hypothetical protein